MEEEEASSAVCAATAIGDHSTLAALLGADARAVESTDPYGVTALAIACCMRQRTCVQLLLAHGADANRMCSELGPAPLHMACQEQDAEVVSLLLDARADPHIVVAGKSALQVASSAGSQECLRLLEGRLKELEDARPAILISPELVCDAARDDQEGGAERLRRLLDRGASASACDAEGHHPLLHACASGLAESARLLIERRALPDAPSASGSIALSVASLAGHASCVALLIDARAAVDQRCELGTTALHGAVAAGHLECARLLMRARAAIDCTDDHGATPLHYAACEGQSVCVSELLLVGHADSLRVAGGNGQTALQMAKERGHAECMELLARAEAEAACARADAAAAELLQSDAARCAADDRLKAAIGREDLTELRVALDACAVQASDDVVQRARSIRDRLKKRQKKAASRVAATTTSAGADQRSDADAADAGDAGADAADAADAGDGGDGGDGAGATTTALSAAATAGAQPPLHREEEPPATVTAGLSPVPEQYLCPITLQIMQDPVITADGHTYEREAIEEWLRTRTTSPSTGAPLPHRVLTPSIALRQLIAEYESTAPRART